MPDVETNVTDLEYVFAAPINAVVKADFMAAQQFVEYVERYGFVHPPPAAPGEPDTEYFGDLRMVSFTFDQMQGGRAERRLMRVPSLSLIPLPLLHVDRAEFDLGVRVISAQRVLDDKRPLRLLKERDVYGLPDPMPYEWRAMLAANDRPKYETREDVSPHIDANINVKVQVGRADIPAGLANLFALLGQSALVGNGTLRQWPSTLATRKGGAAASGSLTALDVDGNVVPRQKIRASYAASDALVLRDAHGGQWESGAEREADDKGTLAFAVAVGRESRLATGEIVKPILFEASLPQSDASLGLRMEIAPHEDGL